MTPGARSPGRSRRPPRRSAQARGQSLVLWALTLLLLGLMVLVTLGVAMRTRERIEAQMTADAAAYSQAVATARAMNGIALMTRAHTSFMVAMTALESLISWAGQMKGALPQLSSGMGSLATQVQANGSCTPADIAATTAAGGTFNGNMNPAVLDAAWLAQDLIAGEDTRILQGIANTATDSQDVKDLLINDLVGQQRMAASIANLANPELQARPSGDGRSLEALNVITGGSTTAAIHATMGSRGNVFTRDRQGILPINGAFTQNVDPNISLTITGGGGGAGFGAKPALLGREQSQTVATVSGYAAWAEDHPATVTLSYTNGGCTGTVTAQTAEAYVMSTDLFETNDMHVYESYTRSDVGEYVTKAPDERHTFGPCKKPYCPGMWPGFLDYDGGVVADAKTLFGQPVLYSIIHRDLSRRPDGSLRKDPWNLRFDFAFTPAGSTFDNGNPEGQMLSHDELRYQVALGTGIAYYHRPNAFKEPPNLFNPFWRATLISAQLYGTDEAAARLDQTGFGPHAAALRALVAKGFKGVP